MTCNAVAVIGGGFAGLSAATALAEAGVRVVLLEARPTLGGRAAAFTDPATGERVDNGQHVLIGCYHETFRFLRRIGARQHVLLQDDLALDIIERDGRRSRLVCPRLPPPLHLLAGLATWGTLSWRDRAVALRVGMAARGAARAPATAGNQTVREWLVARGQTPRLIELLWEPLAVAALNQPIDVASAAPFVVVLGRMFAGSRQDAALGLPLKPLDELYAVPAASYLRQRGAAVRTGASAQIGCAPLAVRVRDEAVRADAVICTVPWHALGATLPQCAALATTIADAAATAASPIVTVNLWFDRIVTDRVFVGLPGRTMQWVFDKRALFGDGSSHLSLVSSGAGSIVALSNDELIALAMREVLEALPAAAAATLRRAVVVREKRATFSVAPGQPARPQTTTAVPGLFLAGDWIDTGLPATIESAVVSGHRAAAAAIEYLEARHQHIPQS